MKKVLDKRLSLVYNLGEMGWLNRFFNRRRDGHYMTLRELEQETGITRSALYMAIYSGRLDAYKSGGTWLSTPAAVERAIESGRLRRKS